MICSTAVTETGAVAPSCQLHDYLHQLHDAFHFCLQRTYFTFNLPTHFFQTSTSHHQASVPSINQHQQTAHQHSVWRNSSTSSPPYWLSCPLSSRRRTSLQRSSSIVAQLPPSMHLCTLMISPITLTLPMLYRPVRKGGTTSTHLSWMAMAQACTSSQAERVVSSAPSAMRSPPTAHCNRHSYGLRRDVHIQWSHSRLRLAWRTLSRNWSWCLHGGH